MAEFYFALVIFYLGHSIPPRAPVRSYIVSVIGERGYRIWYSILSIVLLVWLIVAAINAPRVPIWSVEPWMVWVAIIAMFLACVIGAAGFAQSNPLSISLSRRPYDPGSPGIVAVTRHPILWAFGLWAVGHIPANGQQVWVILFGLLGLFAFAGMALIDARRKREVGEVAWHNLADATSVLPFLAIATGKTRFPTDRSTLFLMGLGVLVFFVIVFALHEPIIGVDPLGLL